MKQWCPLYVFLFPMSHHKSRISGIMCYTFILPFHLAGDSAGRLSKSISSFKSIWNSWLRTLGDFTISRLSFQQGQHKTWIILGMSSANKRRRYNVESSFIGWVYTQNDPYKSGIPWQCLASSPCTHFTNGWWTINRNLVKHFCSNLHSYCPIRRQAGRSKHNKTYQSANNKISWNEHLLAFTLSD